MGARHASLVWCVVHKTGAQCIKQARAKARPITAASFSRTPPTADTLTRRPVPGNGSRQHGPGSTGGADELKDDAQWEPHYLEGAANVTQKRPHSRGASSQGDPVAGIVASKPSEEQQAHALPVSSPAPKCKRKTRHIDVPLSPLTGSSIGEMNYMNITQNPGWDIVFQTFTTSLKE
ncbi:hypothetical protein NDU88_006092 [Pleurodeles waltl]|uniref:Uncharacterized protein n=1 Tax=Pleurodeles waltl TaxID=8319 RepID=A0AAV7TDF8_PLEWA|nr:hypothetical protein NDU88_006092 [Pleurodeles waltl]